jgi:hypothetical protein
MLKQINYFIFSVVLFEFISFVSGFGTHFEHYKYSIMASIVVINSIMIRSVPKTSKVKAYQATKK